jgi:uncharacterized repeat protein (TIGR03803 family)
VTPSGAETVLHVFGGAGDGAQPVGSLAKIGGFLYGATTQGGANGNGAIFKISLTGAETVIYSFGYNGDGQGPQAGLINVGGTLYGTTFGGGANDTGTIFKVTTAGAEAPIYSFGARGSTDAAYPDAKLLYVNNTLFGTTVGSGSGTQGCLSGLGCGTIFSASLTGAENVLYRFGPGIAQPNTPLGGLILFRGGLWGTTIAGSLNNDICGIENARCGTVFDLYRDFTVKYSFTGDNGGTDGASPTGELLNVGGLLYATTSIGGANNSGTVFSLTHAGAETVLHSFGGQGDGSGPNGSLINVGGKLYGTTTEGGGTCGCGTVFAITP